MPKLLSSQVVKAGKGISLAHKLSIIVKKQTESKGSTASLLQNRNMPSILSYLKGSSMQKSQLTKAEGAGPSK